MSSYQSQNYDERCLVQGTDLKNVTLVVQFMVPDSLSVWMQRAGRAGRSGAPSAAILLYEPSVIQKIKGKEADESGDEGGGLGEQLWEDDGFRKKNVEGSLRSYVLTDQCRRMVTDGYFGTPVRNVEGMSTDTCSDTWLMPFPAYSVPCCDNCMRNENPTRELVDITEFLEFMFPALTIDKPTPHKTATDTGTTATKSMGPRREERRAACRDFLTEWRVECWLKNHKDEVWDEEILLPDKVLTKLAATASIQTKEDVRNEVDGWWLWETYSQEVLDGLKAIDARFEAIKAAKEADRLEQQRIEREQRIAVARAEKQRALAEKEEKRRLKEAAALEEKRRKEEAKRQKEELKRQKEEAKVEAKRRKAEAKRQREEEKAKVRRQKEEAKSRREEAKRQREERLRGEDESREHEEKRQRTSLTSFIPIPSSSSTSLSLSPTQSDPSTRPRPRPRPRPITHLPPAYGIENISPTSQPVPPSPFSTFPPSAGFYTHEVQSQFTPPQDILLPNPSWQLVPNARLPYSQTAIISPYHLPPPLNHDHALPHYRPDTSSNESAVPYTATNLGDNQHGIHTFYCERFSLRIPFTTADVVQSIAIILLLKS